jgi:CubicO group peptidase (beta-lactamase class C family)
MKRWISITLLFAASCASMPPSVPPSNVLDAEVQRLMASENVVGLALAVIDDAQVASVAAYGVRDLARNQPLDSDTAMYAASLAKTAFAYTVLQLVDEGHIDLDASIATYLPKPLPDYPDYADLVGDERWRMITPRIVLTHSTGFDNFRRFEKDGKLRLHWPPGSRYGYSGEGFRLLQFVLEEGLGLDVGKEMQVRVFDRFGMTRTSMLWRDDFAENFAETYTENGSLRVHDRRRRVDTAGSMDTTIADQARLWAGVMRGEGLSPESRAAMVRGQLPIRTAHQFPSLQESADPRGATIGLAAGLGVVTFQDASGPMWFKGGHDNGTGNMLVCQEARRRCVVFLSNSVRAERIYPALTRIVLGETAIPWWWEYR